MKIELKYDVSRLTKMAAETPRLFRAVVKLMGDGVEGEAKRLIGGKHGGLIGMETGGLKAEVTGNLGKSIGSRIVSGGNAAEVYATAAYAEYVHEGTFEQGPLKRLPKYVRRGKGKRFKAWQAGKISGMRPRPFLKVAVERILTEPNMRSIVTAALRKIKN